MALDMERVMLLTPGQLIAKERSAEAMDAEIPMDAGYVEAMIIVIMKENACQVNAFLEQHYPALGHLEHA
jgi:hypothetical protein